MTIATSFITLEDLRAVNDIFESKYTVTTDEVDFANKTIRAIKSTRNIDSPQAGDIVLYTSKLGDFYHAHVESVNGDQLYICEKPYVPFVSVRNDIPSFNTSGGAWRYVPSDLQWHGRTLKTVQCWGRFGACASGTVKFLVQVNVWVYSENEFPCSTETHDKFYLYLNRDERYSHMLHRATESYRSFENEDDFNAWKETFHANEYPAPNSFSDALYWSYKSEQCCIPLDEYHELEADMIDSQRLNGKVQECKRVYDGTTIQTYFPYQDVAITLPDGTPEFKYAREKLNKNK